MKRMLKCISIVMVFMLVSVLVLSGCGKSGDEVVLNAAENTADKAAAKAEDANKDSGAKASETKANTGEKKKVVIVQETETQYIIDQVGNTTKTLEQKGYSSQNVETTVLKLGGDESKSQETVDKIKQMKPDVVIVSGERFSYGNIAKKLESTSIPVIVNLNADTKEYEFVDRNGVPKQNITGLYTMPKDMLKNSYEFLNKIAPINGKKAVFITDPGMFTKEDVVSALKTLNIELKDYVDTKTEEDWQTAVLKYNSDSEVGWTLVGLVPLVKKDGKPIDFPKTMKWNQDNLKKPHVTYWEIAVQLEFLCGLGVDLPTIGNQLGDMAARILNGEDVKNVKAESPSKINISLNKKKADMIGIKFPADIMGAASKVFTDYEGHFISNTK